VISPEQNNRKKMRYEVGDNPATPAIIDTLDQPSRMESHGGGVNIEQFLLARGVDNKTTVERPDTTSVVIEGESHNGEPF
jgi:hypothetical protein